MQKILSGLKELKLHGMLQCFEDESFNDSSLSFTEKLEYLIHYELAAKKNKRIERLLANSNLKSKIRIEELNHSDERGLSRSLLLRLMKLEFLSQHKNLVITGATGCGKTHLANAIGTKACIEGYSVKLVKMPLFLEEMQLYHQTGTFNKLLTKLMQFDLLILDDYGITNINEQQLHDLFNIIDERYQLKSTIITSQLPVSAWHEYLNNPTLADAILDRLLSQSEKIDLSGESLRWEQSKKSQKNKLNSEEKLHHEKDLT